MLASTIGYPILLMNTGRDGPGPSPAAKRQEAFTKVVKRVKPSLIFTQECTRPFVKGLGAEYIKLENTEAGFIFNVNEFTYTDYTYDTDLDKMVESLRREQKISTDFQFLGRVCVVKFTSKGAPNLKILALSWHGQYKLNDTTKIIRLKELFVVVKEMRKLEKLRDKRGKMLPVIIGGDFNIEVTKWPIDPDFDYHDYEPSERRKDRLIDLFVSTKDLMVKDSTFVTMNFKLKDGTYPEDILKHDPVQGILTNCQLLDNSQSSNEVATKNDDTAIKKGKAAKCVDVPAENVKLAKSADRAQFDAGNCSRRSSTGSSILYHDFLVSLRDSQTLTYSGCGSSGSNVNSADRAQFDAGNCSRRSSTGSSILYHDFLVSLRDSQTLTYSGCGSSGSNVNSDDIAQFDAGNCGRGGSTGSSGSTVNSDDIAQFDAGNCGRGGSTGSSGSTVNSDDIAQFDAGNCGRGGSTGSSGSTVNSADRAQFDAGNCGRGGSTGSSGSTVNVLKKMSSGGFNFGGAAGGTPGGFSFGTPTTTAAATAGATGGCGFSFGGALGTPASTAAAPAPAAGGLSFGGTPAMPAASTTSAASTGFSFGGTPQQTAKPAAATRFSFSGSATGTPAAPTGTSSLFAAVAAATTCTPTQSAGGFSFGGTPAPTATQAVQPAPTAGGFSFDGTSVPSTGTPGGFSFGASSAAPAATQATIAPAAATAGFFSTPGLGSAATGLGAAASIAAPTTAATAKGGFSFGGMVGGLSSATSTTATAMTTTASAFPSLGTSTVTTSTNLTTATTTTSSAAQVPSMNYGQLEELINKWTLDLEEQESIFLQQALQVNAWDRLLIENGESITQLNTDVNKVKLDQKRLDHELDFIQAQQKELEEMLEPSEKAVDQLPPIGYQQHADLEREHTYQMSENIDAQLKRMVNDLKEIVEYLNASSGNQDNTDPVHQITRILNAHMDSLQWIDQNSALVQRKANEISKLADVRRREQERNFRLAYN